MKIKFKNILTGALVMAMLGIGASSCTNLDETLYSELNDENVDLTNENDLNSMMGQAIAQFRFINMAYWGLLELEECCDDYVIPLRIAHGWGAQYLTLHHHNYEYSVEHADVSWNYCYNCIGYCNLVLDAMDEDNPYRGQVKFFRALAYYILLDVYRNVPFLDTAELEPGWLPEQITPQELFSFIESEMIEARDNLGTDKVFGWGNKFAACMALAKLYLNQNVYLGTNGTDGYEKALAEVNTVINEGGYSLAPNYLDCFQENIKDCPEIIFAVPEDRTHAAHWQLFSIAMPDEAKAAYGSTCGGWNGSCAVPQFVDTYDADDQRLTDTWAMGKQYVAVKNADGTYSKGTAETSEPIYAAMHPTGDGILNFTRNVHSADNPGAYWQEGYRIHKFAYANDGTDKGCYANDFAFFRYADALMIKAECLLRLGRDKQVAADLVSQVRARNFSSNPSKATRTVAQLEGGSCYQYGHEECTSQDPEDWSQWVTTYEGGDDIELGGLLDDLGWEFVYENHRRQDLIRFKMADGRSVFTGKSWFCKDATTDDHAEIFPIPESAMTSNIKLVQNPGYAN